MMDDFFQNFVGKRNWEHFATKAFRLLLLKPLKHLCTYISHY